MCHKLTPRVVEMLADNDIFSLNAQYCKWLTDDGMACMVDKIIECGGFNICTFPHFQVYNTSVTAQGLRPLLTKAVQHTEYCDFYSGLKIFTADFLLHLKEANPIVHSVTRSPEARAWHSLVEDFSGKVIFLEHMHEGLQ